MSGSSRRSAAPPITPEQLPVLQAVAIAVGFALIAWRLGTLSRGGAVAAGLVGTAVLGGTGWAGGALLAVFFVTGTAVGRLFPSPDTGLDFEHAQRDWWQVWANGGAAAAGGLIGIARPELGLWVAAASLAAANADTWATEIGKALGGGPRDLLSRAEVPPGTSGGVTWIGTLAGGAGAATIAAAAGLVNGSPLLGSAATVLGFGGMLADSAVGSRWQVRRACPECGAACESSRHCGTDTEYCGGVAWINNDTVNALATGLAALGGGLAWWLVRS